MLFKHVIYVYLCATVIECAHWLAVCRSVCLLMLLLLLLILLLYGMRKVVELLFLKLRENTLGTVGGNVIENG